MKRVFYSLLIFFVAFSSVSLQAQDVFDPNDTDVIFTSGNRPPTPGNNIMAKWGHSKLLSWNSGSYGYKSYYFNGVAFRLKYPAGFQKGVNDGKKYGCFVFLHGAGEVGDVWANDLQLIHGSQTHADNVDNGNYDGFLLYPQCWTEFSTGIMDRVIQIVDSLVKYAKVDLDRVVVGGLSSGGSSTFSYLTAAPKSWAAVTPISPVGVPKVNEIPALISVPVWVSNGGQDTKPQPSTIASVVSTYTQLGGDIKQSFYPALGHGVWNNFWAEPGYFDYIKNAHKAQPVVKFQHTEWCPDENIRAVLILQPGFYQYEWQKNGVTISGETKDSLVVTEFGSYRGRFRRTASSGWSDWSPRPVEIVSKGVTVTPPVQIDGLHSNVLPAPDGSVTVPLIIPGNFASYEWRRISDNALVSTSNTFDAPVGQYKVRVMEQFGCSSVFSDPYTVIAANGTGVPDKVTELTAVSLSNTSIEVFWNENPAPQFNETAFEVYRSKTPGNGYVLIGTVQADSLLFVDDGLDANTQYYYIVRAVNDNGASQSSNEASAKTFSDITPPTAPGNLTVTGITRHSVSLSWSPSTDDVGVKYYEIFVNGEKAFNTANTSYVVNELDSFVNYSFYVRAVDFSGNKSVPCPQVTAFTKLSGLSYSVYAGDWDNLPDFSTLTPEKQGINSVINLGVRPAGMNDYFGMVWEGWINITTSGTYTFYLNSDDGSALYIDSHYSPDATPLINNDGLHGATEKSATKNFNSSNRGWHKIAVTFFEKTGDEVLTLSWKRPGIGQQKVTIPASAFADSQSPSGSTPAKPTNLNANPVSFNRVDLSWRDRSSNEDAFEIYRKSPSDPDFVMIGRVDTNVTSFADSATTGSTAYTYRIQAINVNGASGFTANVNTTTPAAPPVPDVPSGLTLEALSTTTVSISFNGNGQTGFEVFRSIGNSDQFRIFRTINTTDNSVNLQDTGLFANKVVYYKVMALGITGNSEFSDVESVQTLNSAPQIKPLGSRYIYFQGSSVVPVSATDADGDKLIFSFTDLPDFANFDSTGNGKGNLVFNPDISKLGSYTVHVTVTDEFGGTDEDVLTLVVNTNRPPVMGRTSNLEVNEGQFLVTTLSAIDMDRGTYLRYNLNDAPSFVTGRESGGNFTLFITPGYADAGDYQLNVLVSDGSGGYDSALINLKVKNVDPSAPGIYINVLGSTPAPSSPWNNITSSATASLLDANNQPSGVGITFSPNVWNTSVLGTTTGNNSGVLPDLVMRDNYYFGIAGKPEVVTFTLNGLEQNAKYRLKLFASSSYSGGSTVYTINGQSRSVEVSNNVTDLVVFNEILADAEGKVTVTMSKGNDATIGYLNAIILEKPYDDGTIPAAPENLMAAPLQNGDVTLQWKNVAYNADGYVILRSDVEDGEYLPVNDYDQILSDDSTFVDTNVNANTNYYYKIFAYNTNGHSDTTGLANALTLNRAPVLQSIDDVFMKGGTSQTINIVATDDEGESLGIQVEGLPAFAEYQNTGNGTGTISIQPSTNNLGIYKDIVVTATDNNGASVSETFNISVSDNSVRTVSINFNGNEAAPWNNYQANPTPTTTITNMVDDMNDVTPFAFKFTTVLGGKSTFGMVDADEGIFSDNVMNTAVYLNNENNQTMQFTGLDPSKSYNVGIFSSFNTGKLSNATFSSGGKTINVSGSYNTNKLAYLTGLTPSAEGTLLVNFNFVKSPGSDDYFLLNVLRLEEYSAGALIQPADLVVEPRVSNKSIGLNWSDRSDSETGYEIYRSVSPNSGFSLIITTAANVTTYTDNSTSLIPGTAYYYKVRAKKGTGNYSNYSNVAGIVLAKSLVLVNQNIPVSPQAPLPWNNTSNAGSSEGTTIENMINTDNINTGINYVITKEFNGIGYKGVNINNGVLPGDVMQTNYWTDAGQISEIKFSGLDLRRSYRVGVFNSVVEVNGRYYGLYTVNGKTKSINGQSNSTKIVYFDDIRPDENGEIFISVTPAQGTSYCFTGAFTLEGYVKPADFMELAFISNENNLVGTQVIVPESPMAMKAADATTAPADFGIIRLNAYPNPFVSNLTAEIELPARSESVQLEMFDIHSRLIFKKEIGNDGGFGGRKTLTLPVDRNLAPGVYTLKLSVGNEFRIARLVKSN